MDKSIIKKASVVLFGKLSTEWKDALVVHVHKKGKKKDVTNYRPISLLSVVSKVLERYIFKHFKEFLCPLFDNVHGIVPFRVDLRSPSCWRFITRLVSL